MKEEAPEDEEKVKGKAPLISTPERMLSTPGRNIGETSRASTARKDRSGSSLDV